ncbi:MAG: hypothetical protein AAF513_14240 [Pseudomonadota bacterium]
MIEVFELCASVASGMLAGALLTEAFILVPYWKRLEVAEFLRLHPTLGPSLYRFFAPLTVTGTLLPIVAYVLVAFSSGEVFSAWLISAAAALTLLVLYFAFFRRANALFASTTDTQQAATTLAAWDKVHKVRTIVACMGFVAAVIALTS